MDLSRTYLSLKLNHMHAVRGTPLTSSSILRETNTDLSEWAAPLWSFHSTHLCPWPKASEASRGLSVEQAVLNSSHSQEVATS